MTSLLQNLGVILKNNLVNDKVIINFDRLPLISQVRSDLTFFNINNTQKRNINNKFPHKILSTIYK